MDRQNRTLRLPEPHDLPWVTLWVGGGLRHWVVPLEAAQAWSPQAGKVSRQMGWVLRKHLEAPAYVGRWTGKCGLEARSRLGWD